MASTCPTLSAASKVTAAGDKQASQDNRKDGGEASAEAGPVQVNEREPIVGLVEGDVT